MMIVKGASNAKKIKIPLHSSVKEISEPLRHVEKDVHRSKKGSNVREIGLLKPRHVDPVADSASSSNDIIAQTLSPVLEKYEREQTQLINQKLAQFEKSHMAEIQAKSEQFHTQQLHATQAEMGKLRDQGYKDGYSEGVSKGEKEYVEQLRELAKAINDVTQNKKEFFKDSEPELVKLALKIAEKIVHTHIELDPAAMIAIVDESIKRITDKDKVIIKTSSEDADFVRQNRDRILEKMPDIRTLEIQNDPRIERGGCVIETQLGFIDSLISTKLSSLETALFKILADD